jgi:hypothetical protein
MHFHNHETHTQARRFPEGSEAKLLYEIGLQNLLISFTIIILIAGEG